MDVDEEFAASGGGRGLRGGRPRRAPVGFPSNGGRPTGRDATPLEDAFFGVPALATGATWAAAGWVTLVILVSWGEMVSDSPVEYAKVGGNEPTPCRNPGLARESMERLIGAGGAGIRGDGVDEACKKVDGSTGADGSDPASLIEVDDAGNDGPGGIIGPGDTVTGLVGAG